MGALRFLAASTLASMSSALQVSTWAGATMPKSRPLAWFAAWSTISSACAIAARPAPSSHWYSTREPFGVDQRAER